MASTFDPSMFDTASGRRLKSGCGPCDPDAELTITPTFLYFGYVPPGALSDWQPLIIQNTGTVDVGVESLTITGEFELGGDQPVLLVPGETVTFSVRFAPEGEGLRGGDLEIKASTVGQLPIVKLVGIGGQLSGAGDGSTTEASAFAYRYGTFAVNDIAENEILMDYHVSTAHRLQSNLAGCKFSVETPPEAAYDLAVLKDGVQVGLVTINPDGSVSTTTNGGSSIQIPVNTIMTVRAPASPDLAIQRIRMTFVGVI